MYLWMGVARRGVCRRRGVARRVLCVYGWMLPGWVFVRGFCRRRGLRKGVARRDLCAYGWVLPRGVFAHGGLLHGGIYLWKLQAITVSRRFAASCQIGVSMGRKGIAF